ncbi:MAG: hypothetical protein GX452_13920 [Ignavibacteriales bacterium]|nr:hypothetical protein [Ignavibacteriales bacterium]
MEKFQNIEEYKEYSKKTTLKHVVFPSGLELDIVLPNPQELLESKVFDAKTATETTKEMIKLIKLPAGLTIADLTMQDYLFLQKELTNFFMPEGSQTGL